MSRRIECKFECFYCPFSDCIADGVTPMIKVGTLKALDKKPKQKPGPKPMPEEERRRRRQESQRRCYEKRKAKASAAC